MSDKEIKMWRYRLTGTEKDPFEWAEVILCSTGFFGAVTDYGNYAFAWRHHGKVDFREFVARIGADYAHSKFSAGDGKVYDDERSRAHARRLICEARHRQLITKTQARDAWNEIEEEYENLDSESMWNNWSWHSEGAKLLWGIFDTETVYFRTKPEPQCWAFCTRLLPRLQAVLREELQREAEAAAQMTGAVL